AIGAAGHRQTRGIGDPALHQAAREPLGVAHLPALVVEVNPVLVRRALGCGRHLRCARRIRTTGVVPAPGRVVQDGVAAGDEPDVVPVAVLLGPVPRYGLVTLARLLPDRLVVGEPVRHRDGWYGPVCATRNGHVDGEGETVEAGHRAPPADVRKRGIVLADVL